MHNLKYILPEILILLFFSVLIRTSWLKTDVVIKADAIGYYDYLPSVFIHHDLIRKNDPAGTNSFLYNRIDKESVYLNFKGYKVDKYPVGTAILQWPFFYFTYLTTPLSGNSGDGYQKPFQRAVLYAAIFYLFLAVIFLRKLLVLYGIKKPIIIFSQILLVFGTGVTNYTTYDAGFSHVYSLFAITAFFYFVRYFFFKKDKIKPFILACAFFGIIILIRQINILVLFFIPFLAGSYDRLNKGVRYILQHTGMLLTGFLLTAGLFFIQCFVWYLQTGHFLLYSYQGEGFHFFNPQFINILFSYRKGLFVYTPILFLSLAGLFRLFFMRKYYQVFSWLFFFLLITYLFSSWHSWSYGASYGSRAFIDYYSIFFILFAIALNESSAIFKTIFLLFSILTIPVNLIQTYQYKTYILHWTDMNKEKYWEVFLKTKNRYHGILWKKPFAPKQFMAIKKVSVGNVTDSANSQSLLIYQISTDSIAEFQKVSLIRISFFNQFSTDNNSKIVVSIRDADTGKTEYRFDVYLIRFAQKQLGRWQEGSFNYSFKPMSDSNKKVISVKLFSEKPRKNVLKDFRINFLAHQ